MEALNGLKILDLSRYIAGPNCTMVLGDLGADVVKVESIGRGEETRILPPFTESGIGIYTLVYNRNKRSISINLRSPEGQEVVRKLAQSADVMVENFRPGTLEKMGCSWETLHALNERLILLSISGYGQTGPWRNKPCFDAIAQAGCGLMEITGEEGGRPLPTGTFIVDYLTSLYGAVGILSALHALERTGKGQLVDLAMLDCAISVLMTAIPEYGLLGNLTTRVGSRDRFSTPANNFLCKDGRWVHINAGSDNLFPRLAGKAGLQDLLTDPKFCCNSERIKRIDDVEKFVSDWTAQYTSDEVLTMMAEAEVPCARIDNLKEVFNNVQLNAREQIVRMTSRHYEDLPMHGIPIKLSDTPGGVRHSSPVVGEHTSEILKEWIGCTQEDIDSLIEHKIVG